MWCFRHCTSQNGCFQKHHPTQKHGDIYEWYLYISNSMHDRMKIVHPFGLIARTSAVKLFSWFASPRGGMWPAIGPLHSALRNPTLSAPRNPAQLVDKWLIVEAMKIDWHTMTNDSMNLICFLGCFVALCFSTILGDLFLGCVSSPAFDFCKLLVV